MNPATSVPVVSVRYLPTTPLEFASPWGKLDEREFNRSRALSHALAASTTIRARTCRSSPVALSIYDTPVASPLAPTVTSRAIAFVSRRRRPVASAGRSRTSGLEKFALTEHPRLHCPQ